MQSKRWSKHPLVVSHKVFDDVEVTSYWNPSILEIEYFACTHLDVESLWSALNFEYMGLAQVLDLIMIDYTRDGSGDCYKIVFA